jgi:hypothetical protein
MSKIHEMMVSAVLPIIRGVGKIEIQHVLSSIKENSTPEIYRTTLQGLYSNFTLLKEAAAKTKSHIDDGIVDIILEAVNENANADGLVLS